jgi:outer membrane protein assembly factor BamA
LRPKDRYELAPEIFVNNQDYSFNLGLGLSGTVRNIGGGAQSIVGRAAIRAQSLDQASFDFPIQWIQPYFFNNRLSLNVTASVGLEFRNEYRQNIIESKIGVTSKFNRFNFFNFGFFDWDVNRTQFRYLVDTLTIDQKVKDLITGLEKQFNSIFRITLQHDNTNDIFSPTAGDYLSISAEEAGIIPSLVIKNRSDLRYSQFYKLTIYGKWFKSIARDSAIIFASKLKFGFAQQYGNNQDEYPIPLTERFFAGGSLSVRGWASRALGAVASPILGGKIIIESNLETRIHLTKSKTNLLFLDANKIWLVFFADFGNIWNDFKAIQVADFAVANGFGLRYDAFFGPLRIDFGIKTYDPSSVDNKWVFQKRFFPEVISKGQIQFGIGHSF